MGLGGILTSLLQVVEEPTSNLTAAALLLATFALVVLIAIVATLLYAVGGPQRPAERVRERERARRWTARGAATPGRRRVPSAVFGWAALALVAAALVSTQVITGSRAYCSESCHHEGLPTAVDGAHGPIACVRCHEPGPAALAPGYLVLRAGHALEALGIPSAAYPVPPASDGCAGCHAGGLAAVTASTTRGVRMSHAEPIEAGMSCGICHPGIGHGTASPVPMSTCLPCHDGETAEASCGTCHVDDPGAQTAMAPDRIFEKVRLGPVEDCGGCHDQRSCDACHGIRMPHTTAFKEGGHARDAAFTRKRVCYRCHVETEDCRRCHGDFDAHGEDFASTHRQVPWGSACNGCHKGHAGSFCDRCH